jgi:hypothetical protein
MQRAAGDIDAENLTSESVPVLAPDTEKAPASGFSMLNTDENQVPTAPNSQEPANQAHYEIEPITAAMTTDDVPRSEWQILRDQLRENPHDPEGWNKLVEIAENNLDPEQIKDTYESLLEIYPNTVCHPALPS